ncbi:MAG: class B sortase, partial [Oscillospiraceae bacterium]|nr:class B sortase [Oscillospiraceae bacterium]
AASARQYERYNPTIESDGPSFADLQAVNPDVFGWLTVYGTNIDYPVVQGQNNMRYVNTDARGQHSLSGAIFLDSRSDPNFSDFSSIVYGHHMENRVMFGEIAEFTDRSYFEARRYGMLYFEGREHGLEFFAFVHADAYDTTVFRNQITEPKERQAYLDMLLQIAMHTRPDVQVTVNDRIVLLSTCTPNSTNGRDILIGKITNNVSNDPFQTEQVDTVIPIPGIDMLPGLWAGAGLWVQISIVALVLLLILSVLILVCTKRKRR